MLSRTVRCSATLLKCLETVLGKDSVPRNTNCWLGSPSRIPYSTEAVRSFNTEVHLPVMSRIQTPPVSRKQHSTPCISAPRERVSGNVKRLKPENISFYSASSDVRSRLLFCPSALRWFICKHVNNFWIASEVAMYTLMRM